MRGPRAFIFWCAILVGAIAMASPGARGADEHAREVFARANALFSEGASLLETDRRAGEERLRESIEAFERLTTDEGIRNGRLYYNIGNAYLLTGDIGHAILNYRRALRLSPNDHKLAQNLSYARAQVENLVESRPESQVLHTVFFWHYDLPGRAKFWIFAALAGAGWLLAAVRVKRRLPGAAAWAMVLLFVGASAMGASLVIDDRGAASASEAVITAGSVVARKGPDEHAYEPRFQAALHAGVECRVLERRAGWCYIALADGREAWVPAESLEII